MLVPHGCDTALVKKLIERQTQLSMKEVEKWEESPGERHLLPRADLAVFLFLASNLIIDQTQ